MLRLTACISGGDRLCIAGAAELGQAAALFTAHYLHYLTFKTFHHVLLPVYTFFPSRFPLSSSPDPPSLWAPVRLSPCLPSHIPSPIALPQPRCNCPPPFPRFSSSPHAATPAIGITPLSGKLARGCLGYMTLPSLPFSFLLPCSYPFLCSPLPC